MHGKVASLSVPPVIKVDVVALTPLIEEHDMHADTETWSFACVQQGHMYFHRTMPQGGFEAQEVYAKLALFVKLGIGRSATVLCTKEMWNSADAVFSFFLSE